MMNIHSKYDNIHKIEFFNALICKYKFHVMRKLIM